MTKLRSLSVGGLDIYIAAPEIVVRNLFYWRRPDPDEKPGLVNRDGLAFALQQGTHFCARSLFSRALVSASGLSRRSSRASVRSLTISPYDSASVSTASWCVLVRASNLLITDSPRSHTCASIIANLVHTSPGS